MTKATTKATKQERETALACIQDLAELLAESDAALAAAVAACDAETRAVMKRHLDTIQLRAEAVAEAKRELLAEIDINRSLFDRPKSRVLSGVKLGLRKDADTLDLGGKDEALIARIRNQMPNLVPTLIREKSELVKNAIKALSSKDLQKLGVRYVVGADRPFAAMDKSNAEEMAEAIVRTMGGTA